MERGKAPHGISLAGDSVSLLWCPPEAVAQRQASSWYHTDTVTAPTPARPWKAGREVCLQNLLEGHLHPGQEGTRWGSFAGKAKRILRHSL